jgi:arginyl-tRNA synthetase
MNTTQVIINALQQAIHNISKTETSIDKIILSAPKQKDHGDFATNVALILASQLKTNPRQLAQRIVDQLDLDEKMVSEVSIAGPGFINFRLSRKMYHRGLETIVDAKTDYGKSDLGEGKKTQVEFVSANPTGPLTIGHGRQAVLGDTVARILAAVGYDVTREYYFNDAGRQMRVLGQSVYARYRELLCEDVEFPEEGYQGAYIKDIARIAIDEKGRGLKESDQEYFSALAEREIFKDIKGTLERINIYHDVFFNEKSLYESGKIESVLQTLREKGLAYDQDGAVWLKATELGLDQDRVIVKSTGEPTYRLPDLAYHKDKMERGFDLVIDIFGADHIATFPDVLAGMTALGYDASKVKVLIHQFVTLTEGKEKVKMSTRKANFVTLDELVDEVGTDVVRYFFINRSMSSHLNFDLTLAKTQSDENPVYYVQYAHARICSILRHAQEKGFDPEAAGDAGLLIQHEELDLIKILMDFPRVVTGAAENFEPHRIPSYLEEVATVYHRFQHAGKRDAGLRVVTNDRSLTQARLMLCQATKIVLANGLSMLGISRPEQM